MILLTPVSYTHLDVYKRQGLTHTLNIDRITSHKNDMTLKSCYDRKRTI